MIRRIQGVGILVVLVASMAAAQELPPVAKDTIRLRADMTNGEPNQWRPTLEFWIMGELPSGSIVRADFAWGTAKAWINCDADYSDFDKATKVFCANENVKPTGFAGPVSFTISVNNELHGTSSALYKGTAKVFKHMRAGRYLEFYTDEDWRLPVGYLYHLDDGKGLHLTTWFRGAPGSVRMFLFYQGKEIAKNELCGVGEERDFDPRALAWFEIDCTFQGIYPNAQMAKSGYAPNFDLSANPGEYEIKALVSGKLARTVKFTVRPDGKIDDTISASNKLGRDRAIVAVNINDPRVPYDKMAWKTGAFYGNPLTGFTAPAASPVAAKTQ
jgi:hypothetical protein